MKENKESKIYVYTICYFLNVSYVSLLLVDEQIGEWHYVYRRKIR